VFANRESKAIFSELYEEYYILNTVKKGCKNRIYYCTFPYDCEPSLRKSPSQSEGLGKNASRSTVNKNKDFLFGFWNSFSKFYHFYFEDLVNMSTVFIDICCGTYLLCMFLRLLA
jgi:hypothetical protein